MPLDKIEYVSPEENPPWGQWLDGSTFQIYPNACPERTVQFPTLDVFTLNLGKNSRLNLFDKSIELCCSLGEGAVLSHQGLPESVGDFCLDQNAQLIHRNINKNAIVSPSITIVLNRPGARVDWKDGIILEKNQNFDLNIFIEHVAPNTHSNCLVKSIVKDKGFLKFFCRIFVSEQAENCTVHQRNLNHILSPYGRVTALPNLDIHNRNIEATHGTATQPIPEEILFYLQARGLSLQKAEQLYLESFFQDFYQPSI